jgi:serine/threonine-protein kinase
MDADRWRRIEEIFQVALSLTGGEREAFLDSACGADVALRQRVQGRILEAQSSQSSALTASETSSSTEATSGWASDFAGRRFGLFELESKLGSGGMGEVYRARDTRLGREVAIKVLPRTFAADPDRLARFEREARMLAALNHPHIATIHGIEDLDGMRGLVLELVEGPTLAERIAQRPLPVSEALTVAQQIAEALEAAHERGIIHRDLKPANIKFARGGDVKVLDFGLAKAFAGDAAGPNLSQMPTVTATELTGAIMGTPAYMSPEQARGQAIDKRTDIWAFGCVLYEMVTGRVAFAGSTVSDTIAAILEREPAWKALPDATPPSVARMLRRCLEKDPKRRLRDAGDIRIDLEDALAGPAHVERGPEKPAVVTRREAIGTLVGATIGSAAVGGVALSRDRGTVPRQLTRFTLRVPEGMFSASANTRIAISPDGTHLACNPGPTGRMLVRALRDLEFKPVQGVVRAIPFFSPDGRWLGLNQFDDVGKILKVPLSGGPPVTVCTIDNFVGATWSEDDIIYFVPEAPGGLASVSAAGGQPKEAVSVDFANGERHYRYPCALPGGKAVLLTAGTADIATYDEARILAFSFETGQKKVLAEGGTAPRYSPSGHLLYAHDAKVFAIRFDPERLETSGQPFQVLEGMLMSRNSGAANYDVSASGDLAYIPGVCDGGARTLVWVDRNGNAEPLGLAPRSYLHPRLAPDGRRLAVEIEGPSHDVYTYDFDRGVLTNVTTDGVSHWPVWSPDGIQLGYRSGPMSKLRLWRVAADRSAPPQQVAASGSSQSAESWSPDGRTIAYTVATFSVPPAIMVTPVDGGGAEVFAGGRAPAGSSKFSPDGRWLAYCSNESGRAEVYVQAFPGPGPKVQVSNNGGTDPVWKRNGGELYYRNGDSVMAATVATAPTFTASRPQELWKGSYSHGMSSSCGAPGATSSNYDVTADGTRFLMIKDEDRDRVTSKEIVVVQGWADEVSRLAVRT